MAKYDPLHRYLRRRREAEVLLSFADIERIIGAFLPHAAKHPDWWADDRVVAPRAVQHRAWREAGFLAVLDPVPNRVSFRKEPGIGQPAPENSVRIHPDSRFRTTPEIGHPRQRQ